jgi:TfoX/Sxy family transcriptional regulator of competence genes
MKDHPEREKKMNTETNNSLFETLNKQIKELTENLESEKRSAQHWLKRTIELEEQREALLQALVSKR